MTDTTISAEVDEAIADLLGRSGPRGQASSFSGAGNPDIAAALSEMGWTRLTVPVDDGGLGLGLADLGPTIIRLGEALAPGTWADQAVLSHLVPEVDGRVACLADPLASSRQIRGTLPLLTDASVRGTVPLVAFDDTIDCLVVTVEATSGVHLLLIDRSAPGLSLARLDTDDPVHPLAELTLDGVASFAVVADGPGAVRVRSEILTWMRIFTACELAGVAARVTTESLEYVKQREQFGRAVGSFQAVKHLLAEMTVTTESLAALCEATLDDSCDADLDTRELRSWILKAHAADAAVRVCETGLQVHGGIGFTAEYGLHRFLRRSYFLAAWYGGRDDMVSRIGRRRLDAP